jgi:hypothetical protein
MKKILLLIILTFQTFCIHAQLQDSEKQYIDSLFKFGKLNSVQAIQIQKRINSLNYPEFKVNKNTGEIEITDILTFTNPDKKIIFQRCLEWIAINYGDLVHHDLESGKIIANGLNNLTHYSGYQSVSGSIKISQIQTPANYTLILTIKDNKIKYTVTNITYNFKNFSETIDEISYPISALYPVKAMNQNWVRFFSVLNASSEMFYYSLKNSLVNYVNDAENDYKF